MMSDDEADFIKLCREIIQSADNPTHVALAERWIDEIAGWQ